MCVSVHIIVLDRSAGAKTGFLTKPNEAPPQTDEM
jgi:hypothetical protein